MEAQTSIKSKSIGFILDDPYYSHEGVFFARNPLVRFFEELSLRTKQIYVSVPVHEVTSENQINSMYKCSDTIKFVPRPFYQTKVDFLKKLPKLLLPTLNKLNKIIRVSDMLILRLPCVVGPLAFSIAKLYRKPFILYVAGDLSGRRKRISRFKGIKKPFFDGIVYGYSLLERLMVRNAPSIFLGQALANKFSTNHRSATFEMSLIRATEVFHRVDTCLGDTVKLLYVGNLEEEKGLLVLLQSIKDLKTRKGHISLEMVGDGPLKQHLCAATKEMELQNNVEITGPFPFGEKLFEKYRSADIFVLPSLSEGVPKTLFEAMAFGLPIVASEVGGVPDIIEHNKNGYLVKAGDRVALTRGIEEVVSQKALRQRFIQVNYKKIQNFTLETQVEKFCKIVVDFITP